MVNEQFKWIVGFKTGNYCLGIILGRKEGTVNSVSFNWKTAFFLRKFLIGFYHTHPSPNTNPSTTDIRTMNAWTIAAGKSLIAVIEAPREFFLLKNTNVKLVDRKNWKSVEYGLWKRLLLVKEGL